jgi:hypothetical protein
VYLRREVRYIIKFEVKYCVLKLKGNFINFVSKNKYQVSDRAMPVFPYSESRTTKNIYLFSGTIYYSVQYNTKITPNSVLYNPLLFWAHRKYGP